MSGLTRRQGRKLIINKRLNTSKWSLAPVGSQPPGIRMATDEDGNLQAQVVVIVNPQDLEPLAPGINRAFDHHIENVSDPAAGADASFTFPADQTWLVVGLMFKLVCDTGVANRTQVIIHEDPSGNEARHQPINFTQTASVTRKYNGAPDYPSLGNDTGVSTINYSLPIIYAEGGDKLKIVVTNKESGDQLSDIAITCQRVFGSVD